MGPFVKRMFTICSNGSVLLTTMAAMPIYGKQLKIFFSRTKIDSEAESLYTASGTQSLLSLSNDDTRMTFDLFMVCQLCILVALAIMEEVAWHLQLCHSWFYQVSES